MDKRADQTIEDNPRLFRPLQAVGLAALTFGVAFLLLWGSFTTDAVGFLSRLSLLVFPVALGGIPVPLVGAFVRRRTWFARPALRGALVAYGVILLICGAVLNARGFGIMGPPPASSVVRE